MKSNDLEIYVHIPFCVRKCDYCDFVSFACNESIIESYFSSLEKQIINKSETAGNMPVVSVFFGGGTPSVPNSSLICHTLDIIRENYNVQKDAEITIEMNPNSASLDKLTVYKKAGFNRLSIGLQSADDTELKTLSRLHNVSEFMATYENAIKVGFTNINVDIMSALPGQTLGSYQNTLRTVCGMNPQHISAYSLIIEEGTPFYDRYKDNKGLPDEDLERSMYYETENILNEYGYHRYEISNYSKAGYECVHNTGYWKRRDYLGFGISAASLFEGRRYLVHSDLNAFIGGDHGEACEVLTKEDEMAEFMFLGLRMIKGVSKKEFFECFGLKLSDVYGDVISKLERDGLLIDSDYVSLTKRGLDVSNIAMAEFLPG